MNRKLNIFKFVFIFGITVVLGYILNIQTVFADSYPMTCSIFEVSKIENNGSFSKVACYDKFSDAQNKMKENTDYVVRSGKSLSPTKIIDMNSGIVYSYPARNNSATLKVYSALNDQLAGSGVSSYTDSYRPMQYISSKYMDEKYGYTRGWIKVSCHGFVGYTDLEAVDFVPTKFIKNGIAITLGGNQTYTTQSSYKVICKANTYKAVKNGNYTDLVLTTYLGHSSNGGVGTSYSYKIGVAPDFMSLNVDYYSDDGINFYSDMELKNLVGTYYNYYQFLPFRTKTKIQTSTISSFITSHKSDSILNANEFKNNEAKYGCNAALILSMGIHESAWGTSGYAKNRNNLFGINAVDYNPDNASTYVSTNACIEYLMADFLANYMDVKGGNYFSMSLGNKGGGFNTKYASDMYWAEKISQYYYDLDKYSCNYNGNLTDYNTYDLALVNTYNVDVKKEAKSNSATLYTTANKNGYQKNLITVTLGTSNGYTKVQLSNMIDGSGNVIYPTTYPHGTSLDIFVYNFDRSVGYIQSGALVPINYSSNQTPSTPEKKQNNPAKMEPLVSLEDLKLEGNNLTIKGIGLISYCNFDDLSKVKHEFVIKNLDTGNEASFDLTSEEYAGFGLNDGYEYKYIGFKGTIDLTQIINGSFKMSIKITNGEYTKEQEIRSNEFDFYNISTSSGNITNIISSNPRYGYRLELEIVDSPIDYSQISVVDNRPSLFSFDNFTLNLNDSKDNINIHLDGQAFIFYTNYNNPNDVTYTAYLIKDHEHYKELNTQRKTCSINLGEVFNSSYDLTNVCYEVNDTIDDEEIVDGEYKMILKIEKKDGNKTYIDYVEMTNLGDYTLPVIDENTEGNTIGTFKPITSNVRERMIIEVERYENE